MADSLKIVGVKRLVRQTGNDLTLDTPTRGSDQHQFRRWWNETKSGAMYVDCTRLSVSRTDGDVKLVIPTTPDTRLDVGYDGDKTFTFGRNSRGVDRVAVFTNDLQIIEEYIFPHISGGKVMKVTPAGAASYPGS